jgi:hypothetical protein
LEGANALQALDDFIKRHVLAILNHLDDKRFACFNDRGRRLGAQNG